MPLELGLLHGVVARVIEVVIGRHRARRLAAVARVTSHARAGEAVDGVGARAAVCAWRLGCEGAEGVVARRVGRGAALR